MQYKNYNIKNSKIHGKGVFANKDLPINSFIGKLHDIINLSSKYKFTELGKKHNHSDKPNSRNELINNSRYLVTNRPIKKGEELTTNYRQQPDLEQPEDFKHKAQIGGGIRTQQLNTNNSEFGSSGFIQKPNLPNQQTLPSDNTTLPPIKEIPKENINYELQKVNDKKRLTAAEYAAKYNNIPQETVTQAPQESKTGMLTKLQTPLTTMQERINPGYNRNFHGTNVIDDLLPTPRNVLTGLKYGYSALTTPSNYRSAAKVAGNLVDGTIRPTTEDYLNTANLGLSALPVGYGVKKGTKFLSQFAPSSVNKQNYKEFYQHIINNPSLSSTEKAKLLGNLSSVVATDVGYNAAIPLIQRTSSLLNKRPIRNVAKDIALTIGAQSSSQTRTGQQIKQGLFDYLRGKIRPKYTGSTIYQNFDQKMPIEQFKKTYSNTPLMQAIYPEYSTSPIMMTKTDKWAAPYIGKKPGELAPSFNLQPHRHVNHSSIFEHYVNYAVDDLLDTVYKNNFLKAREKRKIIKQLTDIQYNTNRSNLINPEEMSQIQANLLKINRKLNNRKEIAGSMDMDYIFNENIAGHMYILDDEGLTVRDIWKFTPSDYSKRWTYVADNDMKIPPYYNKKEPFNSYQQIFDGQKRKYKERLKTYTQSSLLDAITTPQQYKYHIPISLPKKRLFGGKAINQPSDLEIRGYKKDSPYKYLNQVRVNSNTINTDNIEPIALLLINDKGDKKIVYANTGDYTLPNSEYITEYPIRDNNTLNYYRKQISK